MDDADHPGASSHNKEGTIILLQHNLRVIYSATASLPAFLTWYPSWHFSQRGREGSGGSQEDP